MKVAWGLTIDLTAGQAAGFTRASIETKKAGAAAGIVWDDDATIVLHWASPVLYSPLPGKKNILYTVYEAKELLPEFTEAFENPLTTAIIAPSTFVQHIFQRYTKKPVYMVPHGFDPGIFNGTAREWSPLALAAHGYQNGTTPHAKQEPFLFLYVGAANPRKGIDYLLQFWRQAELYKMPLFRLLVKTTPNRLTVEESQKMQQALMSGELTLLESTDEGFLIRHNLLNVNRITGQRQWLPGNLFVDTRRYSDTDLADLYRESHCFLYPSRGEGFGFGILEAMATGLPCIATNYSGYLDFCSEETAYLVKYSLFDAPNDRGTMQTMAQPDPKDFNEKVRTVIQNYRRAALKGKRAMEFVHKECTWTAIGRKLKSVLQEIGTS
jgi:glycosyltransferase involved in cell wall biosynthesis